MRAVVLEEEDHQEEEEDLETDQADEGEVEGDLEAGALLRCMMPLVTNVERNVKSHSNQLEISPFFVAIALRKEMILETDLIQETEVKDKVNQGFLRSNLIRLMPNLIKYLEFYQNSNLMLMKKKWEMKTMIWKMI